MYDFIMILIAIVGVSLVFLYVVAVLVNWALGWVKDEDKDLFGRDLLEKWGLIERRAVDDGFILFLKLILVLSVISAVALTWAISLPILLIIAALFGIRGFYRFKHKVNTALNIKGEL